MYQMKGLLRNKRRLLLVFELLKVTKILMLDCANFWCFCGFFGLFGSNGFYSFISGGNSFFLIELNPWIFKFSLVNYNSMVEFSD